MFKFIKSIIEYIFGTCATCKHEDNCPYIKYGNGSCFETPGFLPKYEKR